VQVTGYSKSLCLRAHYSLDTRMVVIVLVTFYAVYVKLRIHAMMFLDVLHAFCEAGWPQLYL